MKTSMYYPKFLIAAIVAIVLYFPVFVSADTLYTYYVVPGFQPAASTPEGYCSGVGGSFFAYGSYGGCTIQQSGYAIQMNTITCAGTDVYDYATGFCVAAPSPPPPTTCTAPQVLLSSGVCGSPPTCTAPEVLQADNTCAAPPPTSCNMPTGEQHSLTGSGALPNSVCWNGCNMDIIGGLGLSGGGWSGTGSSLGTFCSSPTSGVGGGALVSPPPSPVGVPDPCIAAGTCTPVNASCLTTGTCTGTGTGPGGTVGGGGFGNGTGTSNQDLINYLNSATGVTGHSNDLNGSLADQKTAIQTAHGVALTQGDADSNFISSIFHFSPVANTCAPLTGSIHGISVNINLCTYTEMLRSLLAWLFGLFTAYTAFSVIFRAKT